MLWAGDISAQSQIRILNSQDGSPVFGAHITIENGKDKWYCTSDEKGECKVDAPVGNYKLSFSHLAF